VKRGGIDRDLMGGDVKRGGMERDIQMKRDRKGIDLDVTGKESGAVSMDKGFLGFSGSTAVEAVTIDFPRMERDIQVDERLQTIQDFLESASKPDGLDNEALKCFL
jgi:hypothetical protein